MCCLLAIETDYHFFTEAKGKDGKAYKMVRLTGMGGRRSAKVKECAASCSSRSACGSQERGAPGTASQWAVTACADSTRTFCCS